MMTKQQATETAHDGPFFSIVIAVYNRQKAVVRCLKSLLNQDFQNFEAVCVDGNSTDGTVAAIESMGDPRIRVVREEANSGVWGARCLGFEHSRGLWAIVLDSDDEMADGALRRLYERAKDAAEDVGVVGASYRDDDGNIHPWPPFPEGPFGLADNLQWLDRVERADYLGAFRKEMLEQVELPPPMGKGTLFELNIFEQWRKDISQDVCGLIHMDVLDRLTGKGGGFSVDLFLLHANQSAEVFEGVLRQYGRQLRRCAPRFFLGTCRQAGTSFMAGGRFFVGAKFLLRYLISRPLDIKAWGALVFGLFGPRAVIWGRRRFA